MMRPAAFMCAHREWALVVLFILPLLSGCETEMAVSSGAAATRDIRSRQDASTVLRNATGKFCPSIWCGAEGYQVASMKIDTVDGSLVIVGEDGSKVATIPIASLAPSAGSIMNEGVVHFTSDAFPALVTTEVETQRLVIALDQIKSDIAQPAATAVAPPVAERTAPAPQPVEQEAVSSIRARFKGKIFAVTVLANCPANPDPTALATNDDYSKCRPSELARVRDWIGEALAKDDGVSIATDQTHDYALTVTLTQDVSDRGGVSAGIASWFLPVVETATVKITGIYEVSDSHGKVLGRGTVHQEGHHESRWLDIERQFAEEVAASALRSPHAAVPSP